MENDQKNMTPQVAIVSSPGISHLIPLVEFSKRLVSLHSEFQVTFYVPTLGPISDASKALFESLPQTIHPIFLPPVSYDDLPKGTTNGAVKILLAVTLSLPSLREELQSLISRAHTLVALVADPFAVDALHVAKQLNISPYLFHPSNAMALSLFLYLPKLNDTVSCEYPDVQEPFQFPGCVPIHGRDFPDPLQNRSAEAYERFLRLTNEIRLAEGILVNSFDGLEGRTIRALKDKEEFGRDMPDVYPLGPIIQSGSSTPVEDGSKCLEWLNGQPPKSVLFVSFGSGGTLSRTQMDELALGLELSGQKFLWVARAPSDLPSAAYFGGQKEDPLLFLPEGFLERTEGQGLVVPSWAPQIHILSHESTGGFLTHCGWSSTLESVVHGVPLIAWPLYAEQKMNAVMLSEGVRVALRVRLNEKGVVEREEIGKVVKNLMQGEEGETVRKRMEELKRYAADAVSKDGTSTKALTEVALKWKKLAGI